MQICQPLVLLPPLRTETTQANPAGDPRHRGPPCPVRDEDPQTGLGTVSSPAHAVIVTLGQSPLCPPSVSGVMQGLRSVSLGTGSQVGVALVVSIQIPGSERGSEEKLCQSRRV
jgi:hypothetical protein